MPLNLYSSYSAQHSSPPHPPSYAHNIDIHVHVIWCCRMFTHFISTYIYIGLTNPLVCVALLLLEDCTSYTSYTDSLTRKGMYVCNDSAAPANARTRAHRPVAPRQSSGVSQTPQSHGLSAGRHSTQTTIYA